MQIVKIDIDEDKCTGCKTCVQACFVNVYRFDEIEEKPVVAYPEDCCWCLTCELYCPKNAINVVPKIPVDMPNPF